MTELVNIEENLKDVRQRIDKACQRVGRASEDVKIIAVTKYVGLAETKELIRLGLVDIGESRVQEALHKKASITYPGLNWHLIGSLQTNKINKALDTFSYFHSIDRLSLAEQLNRKAGTLGRKIKCFIQVNISRETTKNGVEVEQLFAFVQELAGLTDLEIIGLMTMAPHFSNSELARPIFRKLRELKEEINNLGILSYDLQELSMGMSNDYEIAIEEGATYIRIGSTLFK